jgi:hypothetical protein
MNANLRLPGYPLPLVPRDEKQQRPERQAHRRNPRTR